MLHNFVFVNVPFKLMYYIDIEDSFVMAIAYLCSSIVEIRKNAYGKYVIMQNIKRRKLLSATKLKHIDDKIQ